MIWQKNAIFQEFIYRVWTYSLGLRLAKAPKYLF